MTSSDKKYLQNCGFIKTVLMILVIFYHSCVYWTGSWFDESPVFKAPVLDILSQWLNSFHIYAFTLVSGYIFAFKIYGGGYNEYFPFVKNKAKRLLIPYVFTAVIWVIPISVYFFNWDAVYILKRYILCINPSQLWFLWMLFGVFAIMRPLWNVFTGNSLIGGITAFGFWCTGVVGSIMLPNIFCIWSAFKYIPFFYIGIRIRLRQENGETLLIEKVHWTIIAVTQVILFIISEFVGKCDGIMWSILNLFITLLLNIFGAVMAFVVLNFIAEHSSRKNNKLFEKLSSYSMPMYLFHQQIIYFTIYFLTGK